MPTKAKRYPYIITCGDPDRCVVFGFSSRKLVPGDTAELADARMVLEWTSACQGLFGLAANGPKPGCRLTPAVPSTSTPVVRVIEVPDAAAAEFVAFK